MLVVLVRVRRYAHNCVSSQFVPVYLFQGDPGVQGIKGDGGPKGEPVSSRPDLLVSPHSKTSEN